MHQTARWTARHSYVALAFVLLILALILAGCAGIHQEEKRPASATPVGGRTGGVVQSDSSSRTRRALIGAVIGGDAGTIISRQMDAQAMEIRQRVAGATVERIAQGIEVTFASTLLYDLHTDQLRPEGEQLLRSLATTFDRYRDTDLLIVSLADSLGSDGSKPPLSERRARSVSGFLVGQGVRAGRLRSVGQIEVGGLDANVAVRRRPDNERVEVAIFASASYRNELTRQRHTR
jgi:outer membrane protein OmpA-like peptidoglycan-associated protein